MERIQMVDLLNQYLRIKGEVDEAMNQVIMSTAFIQGKAVAEFGQALKEFVGVQNVIPCANGTDALQIAMMALDFKPGDEIILPVHTYVATAEVMGLLGLNPVFVEVDRDTFNIDVKEIESKITKKTVAIVPVHLYGQCAEMESIIKIAAKYKLQIIEDAAQALGAEYVFSDGTKLKAGGMGTIGTTSFFPSKNLGCFGDGGAIFTNDDKLAEKIKMIANHGQKVKYHHEIIGVNSRLDTLQAAILNVKLKYINDYTRKRNEVASFYDKELKAVEGLEIPVRAQNSTHVFHQYTLKVREGRRDKLRDYLETNAIPTMIYYPVPLHLQKAYSQSGYGEGSFPTTERLSKTVISLPIHTEMDSDQMHYITEKITKFF